STWRVVPGLSATSPNLPSRVSVRNSEVLPVFVCPTTAILSMASVMACLQPAQRFVSVAHDGLRCHARGGQAIAPYVQSRLRGRRQCAGGGVQPDSRLRGFAGERGDKVERAAIGRLAGVAGDQQPSRARVRQGVEQAVALFAAVELA